MADVPLGSAWVDVRLGFDKLNADMKTVGSKLSPLQASATKAFKEQNALLDKQNKHVLDILGVTEKAAEADKARLVNMSFLDKTMSKMGANIGKGGMMGAQLSYAAQDFVTGLAMGNVNMAIMGASNNLGMMAMQISSAAAAWTTLGLVSIPLAITAFKAFMGVQKEVLTDAELLQRRFANMRFDMALDAKAREALTAEEVKRMHGVANLQGRLEGEKRAIEDINEALKKQNEIRDIADKRMRGFGESGGTLPGTDADVARYRQMSLKILQAEQEQDRDTAETIRAQRYELERGILNKMGRGTGFRLMETAAGGVEARKTVTDDQKATAEKEHQTAVDEIKHLEEDRNKRESDQKLLRERHEQQAREELEFLTREQRAGFNKYELGKIRLDREQKELRRQREEQGFADVILTPAMAAEDRRREIETQFDKSMNAAAKQRKEFSESQGKIGRHISKAQAAEVSAMENAAVEAREKQLKNLEEKGPPGAVTALDVVNRADKAAFAKKRLELAQQFANQGTGHFTGIEQLAKDVQQGIGGPKGLDIAQQQLDTQKGQKQALDDILRAVQNMNLGVGP